MSKRILIFLLILAGVGGSLALFFRIWSLDQSGRAAPVAPAPGTRPKPPAPPPALPKPDVSLAPAQPEGPGAAPVQPDPEPEPAPQPEPQPRDDSPAALVARLGAESYVDRRRAENALIELGKKAVEPLKKQRDNPDPEIRARTQKLLRRVYVHILLADKAACRGEADEPSNKKQWPCRLTINEYDPDSGAVKGRLEWPSLKAVHEIAGTFKGGVLEFKETKFVKRGDAVLNCVYTLRPELAESWKNGTLKGSWRNPNSDRGGTIQIFFDADNAPEPEKPELETTP